MAYHLDNPSRAESYLDECGSLVAETDYCISHILHYGEGQIADTEYSREGYSRWRSLSEREAEELCRDHLTISKDVDTAGSVTFVIEPTGLIYDYYCAGGEVAASVTIGGTTSVVGDTGWQQEVDWESLAQSRPPPARPYGGSRRACSSPSAAPPSSATPWSPPPPGATT